MHPSSSASSNNANHVTNNNNQQWIVNGVTRRLDNFPSPQPSPVHSNDMRPSSQNSNQPFLSQAQASGISPIRRPVPMPNNGNLNGQQMRGMSASVFNLNQHQNHHQQQQQQQQSQQAINQWGFTPVNQVNSIIQCMLCSF
jgi:hypothetical protein